MIAVAFCAGAAAVVWVRPPDRHRVMGAPGRGLRGARPRPHGAHEPAHADAAERTRERDHAGAAADGARTSCRVGGWSTTTPRRTASYPWSPQGVPDLNIIAGLPSVSGYASIVNGNYESVTHTHEQDDLDIGQLASGTLDRLDLREIVTVPEYFLVPLQSAPRSIGDIRQVPENIDLGPRPAPRLRRGVQRDRLSLLSRAPARPALGPDRLVVLRRVAASPTPPPSSSATPPAPAPWCAFGSLSADGSTRWGALVPVAAGTNHVTGPLPKGNAVGLSLQVVGSLPSQRAVVNVAGRPYELGGSLSSALVPGPWRLAGFSQGYAVFTLQQPPVPITAAPPRDAGSRSQVVSSLDEVRADPRRHTLGGLGDPLRRLGLRVDGHGVSQRRDDPKRSRLLVRSGATGPHPRRVTTW